MHGLICPISKVGAHDTSLVGQSRPIVVLPQIYRLWATVMCSQVTKALAKVIPLKVNRLLPNRGAISAAYHAQFRTDFFFPRLPNGQYGPVSQLSRSEKCCTGPFNWGEAHCAGEKVKRKIGLFQRKSL